jgi:hypothetical protein
MSKRKGPKLSFYIPEDDKCESATLPATPKTNHFSISEFREGQHGYLGSSTRYITADLSPSKQRNFEAPPEIDWNDDVAEPEPDRPWLDPAYVHHLDDTTATPRRRTASVLTLVSLCFY